MPTCPSCGRDVLVLCADDGLCKDCSPCCRAPPGEVRELRDRR